MENVDLPMFDAFFLYICIRVSNVVNMELISFITCFVVVAIFKWPYGDLRELRELGWRCAWPLGGGRGRENPPPGIQGAGALDRSTRLMSQMGRRIIRLYDVIIIININININIHISINININIYIYI